MKQGQMRKRILNQKNKNLTKKVQNLAIQEIRKKITQKYKG